jgi:alpha-ketoglutarate-dependent taurine dioxygenase
MELQPLGPALGVEVTGVDLSEPMDNARFAAIRRALNDHCLVLIRGQDLSEGEHVAFARRFGDLQIHVLKQYLTTPYPELYVLSNKAVDGKPIGNHKEGWNWHSDLSYLEVPCLGSVLYSREVPPEGADTLFASMYAAYDALDAATKATIADLKAVHSYAGYYGKYFADRTPLSAEQKAATPDVIHPIVRTHPETGRKSLYVGQDIVKEILGPPAAEGAALLARLNEHAISEDFTYRHKWRAGDVVIWDNRSTMHKATPYDDQAYIRVMHRATIKGVDRPG